MTPVHPAFRLLATYWRLSDRQMRHFWSALSQSQYSQPRTWRQQVLLSWGRGRATADHLLHGVSTPQAMLEVVEALIHEQQLSHQEGHAIEECFLRATTADGGWKNEPRHAHE